MPKPLDLDDGDRDTLWRRLNSPITPSGCGWLLIMGMLAVSTFQLLMINAKLSTGVPVYFPGLRAPAEPSGR